VQHLFPGNGLQQGVALQATAERVHPFLQAEQADHLMELRNRVSRPDIPAEDHLVAHQQPHIPGQENPLLPPHDTRYIPVIPSVIVQGVEPGGAKISGQPADIDIHNEGDRRQRDRPQDRRR